MSDRWYPIHCDVPMREDFLALRWLCARCGGSYDDREFNRKWRCSMASRKWAR